MAKRSLTAILLGIILLVTVGCFDSVSIFTSAPAQSTAPVDSTLAPSDFTPPTSMQITVYHATKDALNLVPETYVVDKTDNPPQTALMLLRNQPNDNELIRLMPSSARLLSLEIKHKIAYVNYNQNLSRYGGGSAMEVLLVAAIVNTLTEFPEIEAVQILIDGKHTDTLGGHMDISEPLSRSEQIIKRQ